MVYSLIHVHIVAADLGFVLYIVESGVKHHNPSCPWSYGSWIYNYLCNRCLSPLILWVRLSLRARCRTCICDAVCQWLATGLCFSPVSSTNKTDMPRYNWNIVESGVKHYKTYQIITLTLFSCSCIITINIRNS
jgi:hypothetical protein